VFVAGGTVGNLSALVAARERARRRDGTPRRWAVCVTGETHSSVTHTLRTVMDCDVVVVPGDARGRLTGDALRALPAEAREHVFAVVATAGSTNLGVVDDIAGVGEVAREHGWWLHVDGAYGGAALAAPSVRDRFAGIEHADSFIVDPHKWLFSPFDCCALLYRDPAQARATHTQHADYLDAVDAGGAWNPSDYAIHLTRRARGLPLWFSLAAHGTDAYRDAIEHTLAIAHAGADLVRAAEHLELLAEPELSVVVFARRGWDADDYARWSADLLDRGVAFVTPTRHRGRPCTRVAVVNPATTLDDLRLVFDSLR
jgi:glutamate/tyrosine decarboxylase-like PLP-dependent enzyme